MSSEQQTADSAGTPAKRAADVPALVRVKKSFFFRKLSRDDAFAQLGAEIRLGKKPALTPPRLEGKPADEVLLETCRLIGRYEGITFKAPVANVGSVLAPLDRILSVSSVRAKTVALPTAWWKQDNGHFLAWRVADGAPVALIHERGAYREYDLRSGGCRVVTAACARELRADATTFFPPLPRGVVGASSLMRFALASSRRDVVFFLAFGLLGAVLSLAIPIASGWIFNVLVPGNSHRDLYETGVLLLALVCVLGFVEFSRSLAVLRFEGRASYKLQAAVLDRLLTLKTPFFSRYDAGNLAERALSIEKIRVILSADVTSALVALLFSLLNFALMLYYDVKLALLALALGIVVAAFTLTISVFAYKHVAGYMRMEAIISGFMMQMIGGMQKIRMTATGDKVFDIWADKFRQQKHHYANKQKLLIVARIFTYAFPIFASLCIYLRVHNLMTDPASDFQFGDFIAFNTAYLSFQGALISAFMVTVPVMSIKPAYELMLPILKAEPEDYEGKRDIGELKGDIEINAVDFRYEDVNDLTLRNVSFKVRRGEFVALVGSSGSGKTTLLRLLLGFGTCESGAILFDDVDMQTLDLRTLRDQMGVVMQDGRILQGTVLFNIVGASTCTEEDAWEAARLAGCDDEIRALDNGMQTQLSANASMLSGGQKQRLLIARALVRKPKLLLFDEATSALDNETQNVVSDNINRMNVTRLVIAHRLSTIKAADRVVVLERGSVVEQGTYAELIDLKGRFYELVKKQIG
jgi:NHLM bacteriocin system ABC transporter ATP-binding protein